MGHLQQLASLISTTPSGRVLHTAGQVAFEDVCIGIVYIKLKSQTTIHNHLEPWGSAKPKLNAFRLV